MIAFGGVFALLAAALIGVNLYVQSQGTQAKIQRDLSKQLGTALEIRSMSVTPWGGLELSGITIPQAPPVGPSPFLEACSLPLALFPAIGDQGCLAGQSKRSLGAERRGKMEIARCGKKRTAGGFGKSASKYP